MNKFVKIFFLIAIFSTMALALCYVFLRVDSAHEDLIRELSYHAADKGFLDISLSCEKEVTLPFNKALINADIAFALYKTKNSESLNSIMNRKYFNMDSFQKRTLTYDILNEPNWMNQLLEDKYIPKISLIKNEPDKLMPLYTLYLKNKNKILKNQVIKILNEMPISEYKDFLIWEILNLALKHNQADDFLDFLQIASRKFYIDELIFKFSTNSNNFAFFDKNKEKYKKLNTYLFYTSRNIQNKIKKGEYEDMFSGIKYYPCQYGYDYNLEEFNYPLEAYFIKDSPLFELKNSLKIKSISNDTIKKNAKRLEVYLPYAAESFASQGDVDFALSFCKMAKLKRIKNAVLYRIIKYLPEDKNKFEAIKEKIFKDHFEN